MSSSWSPAASPMRFFHHRHPLHTGQLLQQHDAPTLSPFHSPKHHNPVEEFGSLEAPTDSLSLRVERLPRGESVISAFQSWMGDGFAVHHGEIFYTINRLRKLRMNKRMLEVMEWIMRERPYKLKELDYAYLLEFTAKLNGISEGESLFLCISNEFQNELLYNNLVMACLDKGLIRLSLNYMRKLRELSLPISPFVYNRLIILHSSSSRRIRIPKFLKMMKADGISPHTSTYNILLKIEADEHNIKEVEMTLKLGCVSFGGAQLLAQPANLNDVALAANVAPDQADLEAKTRIVPLLDEKKRLFNELLTNDGNIKVFCHVRPPFEDEGPSIVYFPDEFTIRVDTGDDSFTNSKNDYEFDRVYGPHIAQGKFFDDVRPFIQSAMDGYNVFHICIWAK